MGYHCNHHEITPILIESPGYSPGQCNHCRAWLDTKTGRPMTLLQMQDWAIGISQARIGQLETRILTSEDQHAAPIRQNKVKR